MTVKPRAALRNPFAPTPVPASPDRAVDGLWTLDGERLVKLESGGLATVLVPTEQVLVAVVDLPLPSRRQRLQALPFALEEALAEPLESLHLALGEAVAPRRHLAAAVRHERMAAWVLALTGAGLTHARLVPDALALPVPEPGAWSVRASGARILVRTPDGGGFAVSTALFGPVWAAAERPTLVACGPPPPPEFPSVSALASPVRLPEPPPIDLAQGFYGRRDRRADALLRRLAVVLVFGVGAHVAIAGIETLALKRIAETRRVEAVEALRRVSPSIAADADPVAEWDRLSPADGAGGPFLPLLARASSALAPLRSELTVQSLAYGGDGALRLRVEAADLSGLQRVEAALRTGGLSPALGGVVSEAGRAEGEIVLRAEDAS
jgi:general secretion pathway protein L